MRHETCRGCDGRRLNETALAVKFRDQSIAELTALPVAQLRVFLGKLKLDRAKRRSPATC